MKEDTKLAQLTTLLFFCCGLSINSYADTKNSQSGFLDFNVYPYMSDVENDNVVTINIASKLKGRFSYFSLTNFGNENNANELEDTTSFYSEQNIRWQVSEGSPLDLTLQMNFRSGQHNDRHRLGVRWRLNNTRYLESFFKSINLSYSINFHAIQFDRESADVWQLEHVYRMTFPYLSERLYLAGFADHTFNQDLSNDFPSNPIVSETQLGYRISDNFYAIAEYRVNEYRLSDNSNFALGFEYKMQW